MPDTEKIVNLDDDVYTILTAKLKRHEEQSKFHSTQADQIRKLLNGKASITANDDSSNNFDKYWYWESKEGIAKIKELFPVEEFRSGELLTAANVPNLDDEDYRKKCIYALSVSLANLTKKNIISSRKEIGVRGRTYKVVQ